MDETWEMNMHINPLDTETEEVLKEHKGLLLNNSDDYVSYIKLTEKARVDKIR